MTLANLEDFFEIEELKQLERVIQVEQIIQPEQVIGYSSLETVWKALKDWGFKVDEYAKLQFSPDEYKAWLSGQISEKTAEQQDFLKTMFTLKFPGSPANPRTLIHFRIRRPE